MPAVFLNASLNKDTKNVFEFIDDKLAFGVGEWSYYLTDIGEKIVEKNGHKNWIEWADDYYIYGDYGYNSLKECPKIIQEIIRNQYKNELEEWLVKNNLTRKDLKTINLLHKQYEAISDYSNGINVEEAKKIIAGTTLITGINVLKYLVSLKKIDDPSMRDGWKYYWTHLTDRQGTQLCAVFTGIDPFNRRNESRFNTNDSLFLYEDMDDERSKILQNMHQQFLYYTNAIDEIALEGQKDLIQKLEAIYNNSNASIHSRILNMVNEATPYFGNRKTAVEFISNKFNTFARKVDIQKTSTIKHK